MNQFTKKYQVWERQGVPKDANDYYTFTEYDNLNEAILAPKTGDWYLTKTASVQISDAEEQVIPQSTYVQPKSEEAKPDPAEELAAKYGSGPIGNIGL